MCVCIYITNIHIKNHRNDFFIQLSSHLEKTYTKFSFNVSCSILILLERECIAYKLKTMRKQGFLYSAEINIWFSCYNLTTFVLSE